MSPCTPTKPSLAPSSRSAPPSSAPPAPASPGSAAGRRAPPADPPAGRDVVARVPTGGPWPARARRCMLRRVPERLTPLDASFLHTETAAAHMHVAWKGRFQPGRGRPPITLARVIAQVASRLGGAPRFRMRLAYPAGGVAGPGGGGAGGVGLRRPGGGVG